MSTENMGPMLRQVLLIKQAVRGIVYADTRMEELPYELLPHGMGWCIRIQWKKEGAQGERLRQLLANRHELNVFLFDEYADEMVIKTWYYVNEGQASYEEEENTLVIYAASRISYEPDKYSVCDRCVNESIQK